MSDLLEDILAFLYATGGGKKTSSPDEESTCPQCGAEMEYHEESGVMRCPECGDQP